MKKMIRLIAATLAFLSIFGFCASYAVTAYAAGEYKNAVFQRGVYAADGEEGIVVLFYKCGKEDIVYLNDGKHYVYTDYELSYVTISDIGEASRLRAGNMELYHFDYGDKSYIMDDDGRMYVCRDLTAAEAQQIRDEF